MSLTIIINNLTLAHKGSNGIAAATLPDVCKTPSPGGPVPIPPNIASRQTRQRHQNHQGRRREQVPTRARNIPPAPATSQHRRRRQVSTNMKTWITYSMNVKLEGKNACRLSDKMTNNHGNTVSL
jgi:hypothetical protein